MDAKNETFDLPPRRAGRALSPITPPQRTGGLRRTTHTTAPPAYADHPRRTGFISKLHRIEQWLLKNVS
jgi:hypothetical protein